VVWQASDDVDAIDEYSRRLVDAMLAAGEPAQYVADGLRAARETGPDRPWVLLQYNPFGYGRWGVAPGLLREAAALRFRDRVPLAVMVHEAWVDRRDWRSLLMGTYQRAQLRLLLRFADVVLTSTEALADAVNHQAIHAPVGSNITPVGIARDAARTTLGLERELVVTLFGRRNPSRALDHAVAAIEAIVVAHGTSALTVLNLGTDAPPLAISSAIDVRDPGHLDADALSLHLRASDLVLLPFTDGLSTRRTTLMAALAHGVPVLGVRGVNTDRLLMAHPEAVALTSAGDPRAFATAAVALTRDREARRRLSEAGLTLYAEHFDWPVVARRVAVALDAVAPRSPLAVAA
jgi:glycosyltransferase involved in cell wall biosynthesis